MAIEVGRRERAERLFEGESLAVPLAVSLGLDAVAASRLPFVALDAASAAGCKSGVSTEAQGVKTGHEEPTKTSRFCSLPHRRLLCRRLRRLVSPVTRWRSRGRERR